MRWLLVAMLAACGDDRLPADPAEPPPPPGSVEPAPTIPPTFYRDVEPILTARCGDCHVEGGVAPFPLTSYADASAMSEAIAGATGARVMPPWPADASGACNTFADARWLSEREIAMLAQWHADGAPAGDPADTRLMLTLTPPSFTPTVELASTDTYDVWPGNDEYRCFIVDPGLVEDRFITAVAMRLDRADVVHHMQLYAADNAVEEQAIDERDADDPRPGYACGSEGVGRGLRYVGVWAGGDLVRRWPTDSGIEIKAGHRLVVQLHYHNHGSEPVLDRSGISLELASSVEHVGRITSVQATSFELAPGQASVAVGTEQPLSVVGTETIRAARVHMHGRGTSARVELVRGDEARCLLDIPRWDVGWQLFYRFAEPISIDAGDTIRIRCTYDTLLESAPVAWGAGTNDEMCIAYAYVTR